MSLYLEVVYDDSQRTFDILGISVNSTILASNIRLLQEIGMMVRWEKRDLDTQEEEIASMGYIREKDLYKQLLSKYVNQTGWAPRQLQ